MIRHLFAQNATDLTPVQRLAAVAERLYDMGYQYDNETNNQLWNAVASASEKIGIRSYSEGDIFPFQVHYVMPSSDGLTTQRAVVTRSETGELLAESLIVISLEYIDEATLLNAAEPNTKLLQQITVADFLAQKHPHPVRSAMQRIFTDMRQLVRI